MNGSIIYLLRILPFDFLHHLERIPVTLFIISFILGRFLYKIQKSYLTIQTTNIFPRLKLSIIIFSILEFLIGIVVLASAPYPEFSNLGLDGSRWVDQQLLYTGVDLIGFLGKINAYKNFYLPMILGLAIGRMGGYLQVYLSSNRMIFGLTMGQKGAFRHSAHVISPFFLIWGSLFSYFLMEWFPGQPLPVGLIYIIAGFTAWLIAGILYRSAAISLLASVAVLPLVAIYTTTNSILTSSYYYPDNIMITFYLSVAVGIFSLPNILSFIAGKEKKMKMLFHNTR